MVDKELVRYLYQNKITHSNIGEYRQNIRKYFKTDEECNRFIEGNVGECFLANYKEFMEENQNFDVFPITQQYGHSAESNFYSVEYVVSGNFPCLVGEKNIMLRTGDILILSPNTRQQLFQFSTDDLIICVVIPPDRVSLLFPRLLRHDNALSRLFTDESTIYLPRTKDDPFFRENFNELYQYMQGKNTNMKVSDDYHEVRLEEILFHILFAGDGEMRLLSELDDNDRIVYQFIEYIQENLQDVDLPSVARHFGYHESYVSRIFRKSTGYSFTEILRSLKLNKAALLLISTNKSVEKIMSEIGYSGRTNFFTQFKKQYLVSPREYRAKSSENTMSLRDVKKEL